MYKKSGFTVLETILTILFMSALIAIIVIQKSNLDASTRDNVKKSAINAIYYALEESYYKDHGYYPEYITSETLTVIDPTNFTDPSGHPLGDPEGSYFYQPANCDQGHCQEYTLSTLLEKEPTYTKYNHN